MVFKGFPQNDAHRAFVDVVFSFSCSLLLYSKIRTPQPSFSGRDRMLRHPWRIQRCRRDSGSLVRSFLNLLEWEFCWYSDATADHLGERI